MIATLSVVAFLALPVAGLLWLSWREQRQEHGRHEFDGPHNGFGDLANLWRDGHGGEGGSA